MNLMSGTMRPGIVRTTLLNGSIKVAAPGLFSITDDIDLLPPVMPWFVGNSNSYSQPKVGDEVWVLSFSDNPLQLYWFKKEADNNLENIPMHCREIEVICNRETDNGWATIYFTDGSGWVIGNGETKLILAADGSIVMTTGMPNRCIHVNEQNISLGSLYNSSHSAAYGDVVEEILNSLCVLLGSIGMSAVANPYTSFIGNTIIQNLPKISNRIADISSKHVTID